MSTVDRMLEFLSDEPVFSICPEDAMGIEYKGLMAKRFEPQLQPAKNQGKKS